MIKKTIEVNVQTDKAQKNVNDLNNKFEDLQKKAKELEEELKKTTDPDKIKFLKKELDEVNTALGKGAKEAKKLGKEQTKASKASKLLGRGVGFIGKAFKALGIGLIVGLLAKLGQAFMRNQNVVDGFNVVMTTIGNIMTEVVNVINNVVTSVSESTNGFEKLGKVVSGLLTLAFTPLKGSFFAIKLAVQQAQLAWEQSFFGDKDQETIKTLREGINETKADLLEVATDALNAGKQVAENFGGAISEVGQVVEKSVEGIKQINVEAANASAKASVEADKAARLAAVRIQGIIEQYDREAEVQRQLRDDTSKSVEERIAANDRLSEILEKQIEEEQNLIKVQLNAARLRASGNEDNIEAQEEIIALQNELAAVEAKVTGFKSEQLTNENALIQEQIDFRKELMQIGKDERDRAIQDAQDVLDERKRLIEREIQDDAEKKELLLKAEQDYRDALFEIDNAEEIAKAEAKAKKIEDEQLSFEQRLEMIKSQEQQVLENEKLTEEQRTKLAKQFADARVKITELENQAKEAQLASYANALSQFSDIAGKETAAGKALAVAATLINTYQGASQALTDETIPNTFAKIAAAATVIATGIANVKSIMSVKVPNQAGGVGGNVAAQGARGGQNQPAFNLVGRSNVNQLQTGLEQQETAPVKAFVVSTNVTTQQEADRATESQAAFG